jgi:uncharacterized protein (TIGR01244 family)
VAPQISAADFAAARAAGMVLVINNRPDGETADQIASAEAGLLAAAAGLAYRHIPVAGAFSGEAVREMAGALAGAGGPVLAYCRSGTRSISLWALAQARQGASVEDILTQARAAGYDLSALSGAMRAAHLED